MVNKRKKSIWQREIILPGMSLFDLFNKLPRGLETWLCFAAVGVFMISPVIMSVLALIHQNIDYTFIAHPIMIQRFVYPLSGLCAVFAMLISAFRHDNRGFFYALHRKHIVYLLFILGAVWMLISLCVNHMIHSSELSVPTREETYPMQIGYFILLLPAAVLVGGVEKKQALIRLFEFASLVLVAAALVLWNAQRTSAFFIDWPAWFSSIYTNINYYGYMLSMAVPLAAAMFVAEEKLFWKGFSGLALAFNTVALTYCDTMGAWVACILAMLFLLISHAILEKRVNREALIAVALFAYSFILSGVTSGYLLRNFGILSSDLSSIVTRSADMYRAGSGRWQIWTATVELIGEHPLFGIGFEGIYLHGLKETVGSTRPHNEFLQYALFYGLPAGLAYFAGCLGVFVRALRRRHALDPMTLACLTAAFGYLVSSCFGLTLYCTSPFLFLFLGMGYVREA